MTPRESHWGTRAASNLSLAETFHITLSDGRESLARERAGFRCIYDVLERSGYEHLADARMPRGHTCHLVQHCETAVNFFSGGPVLLDGAGQVLAEAGVKEVIVIPDLETGFGEEIGEILLQILANALQAAARGLTVV